MGKAAEVVRQKKDHIIDLWKETVQNEITSTTETEDLLLLNVLPQLMDDIALVLERSHDKNHSMAPGEFGEIISNSMEHGRHRATTANFTAKKLIKEQRILHKVLIMVLRSESVYDENVGITLSLVTETSMEHSINSFSQSMQDMREKLIATLAHDIRNPLAAANLGLTAMRYSDGEENFNKIREMAARSLRRSIVLVEDLLDTVTVKSGEGMALNFSSCNFVEEVKLVFAEARESYDREFKFECNQSEIKGIFDPTAVRRVVENLITNAVKYGSPDSPITVAIENESNKVLLKVHNEGNSISPRDRQDIFNFLNRSENDTHGELRSWGIGLSFVRMAAEAHGGHVELESDDENGTTFHVVFFKTANEPGKKRAVLNLRQEA